MLSWLKSLIPQSIKKIIWRIIEKPMRHSGHLRTSTEFADIGTPGPLIKHVFEPLKDVPGWFNVDDCAHFNLVLKLQTGLGQRGDLLEIGSYHGRSTAMMATALFASERLVVCDLFESDLGDHYDNRPSPARLIKNILGVNPGLAPERIVIHKCLSNDLVLSSEELFRFIHVDGGHSAEQAYFDLTMCRKHLKAGGVMVMDDYCSPDWPEVTTGTDRFLAENPDMSVVADLNRHGATGRKLYLMREASLN